MKAICVIRAIRGGKDISPRDQIAAQDQDHFDPRHFSPEYSALVNRQRKAKLVVAIVEAAKGAVFADNSS